MDLPNSSGGGTHGEDEDGEAPGEMIHDPRAEAISREQDQKRRRILAATARAPRPAFAPVGGVLLLVVAVFLLAAQWTLYPIGQTGQDNALRDLGCGIVVGLAGLRILAGQPGRHLVATTAAFLGGLALLLGAVLASHTASRITGVEIVTGVIVLLGALLSALSPERSRTVMTGGRRKR